MNNSETIFRRLEYKMSEIDDSLNNLFSNSFTIIHGELPQILLTYPRDTKL